MIWSQEIRNDKPLYLTTTKSGWPRGVDTQSSSWPRSRIGLFRLNRVWVTGTPHMGPAPRRSRVDQQGNYVPTGPGCLKNICQELPDRYTHTVSNGKSAWATTGNV